MTAHIPDAVRKLVRERAHFCCEYCHLPEGFSFYTHQVDHIRAQKHAGSSLPPNLAWACFDCNNAKGSDLTSYDPFTDELMTLYNPRTQIWDEHFKFRGGEIVGITPVGRATVVILQMNREEQVETRSDLIEAGIMDG